MWGCWKRPHPAAVRLEPIFYRPPNGPVKQSGGRGVSGSVQGCRGQERQEAPRSRAFRQGDGGLVIANSAAYCTSTKQGPSGLSRLSLRVPRASCPCFRGRTGETPVPPHVQSQCGQPTRPWSGQPGPPLVPVPSTAREPGRRLTRATSQKNQETPRSSESSRGVPGFVVARKTLRYLYPRRSRAGHTMTTQFGPCPRDDTSPNQKQMTRGARPGPLSRHRRTRLRSRRGPGIDLVHHLHYILPAARIGGKSSSSRAGGSGPVAPLRPQGCPQTVVALRRDEFTARADPPAGGVGGTACRTAPRATRELHAVVSEGA